MADHEDRLPAALREYYALLERQPAPDLTAEVLRATEARGARLRRWGPLAEAALSVAAVAAVVGVVVALQHAPDSTAPGHPTVAKVTGTIGTLTVNYPAYCGILQADALFGPDPWQPRAWAKWTIYNCRPPTTTVPPTTPTTTTTRPPHVESSSVPLTATSTSALPFTASVSSGSSTTTPPVVAAAELPFTGVNTKELLILGLALILLGASLLTTVESRRRMLRRANALRTEQLKNSAGRAGNWFLGL